MALKCLYLLGKRRPSDTQPFCSATKIEFLGDCDKVAQLTQLHRSS